MKKSKFEPCGYSKVSIQELAETIRKGFTDDGEKEFSPRITVEAYGGVIAFDGEAYKEGPCGIEVRGPKDFTITVPEDGGIQNGFTLMHCLGHYLLQSELGKIPLTAPSYANNCDREEYEASWFAAAILMPRKLLLTYLKGHKRKKTICSLLGVSKEALSIREKDLETLGFITKETKVITKYHIGE